MYIRVLGTLCCVQCQTVFVTIYPSARRNISEELNLYNPILTVSHLYANNSLSGQEFPLFYKTRQSSPFSKTSTNFFSFKSDVSNPHTHTHTHPSYFCKSVLILSSSICLCLLISPGPSRFHAEILHLFIFSPLTAPKK